MKIKSVYLIAKYSARPKNPKLTSRPGYMLQSENIAWQETVNITLGLKNKDFLAARIVLNVSNQTVERNSFQNGKSFEELFGYFFSNSQEEIRQQLRMFGIEVGEKNDEQEHVSEDVPEPQEESGGSECSAEAESPIA